MNLHVEMDMVVHDVLAQKREPSAGTVETSELGAVDFKLRLPGEMIFVSGCDHGIDDERSGHPTEGEIAIKSEIGRALR